MLIPACASSSPAFHMMFSAYKLNKQGDKYIALTYSFPNLEPVCCSMSISNYCFLTCIQVSLEAGKVVWYSYLLKNFLQFVVIHTVKGFGIVNKSRNRCFSGTLLLFLWSNRCQQFKSLLTSTLNARKEFSLVNLKILKISAWSLKYFRDPPHPCNNTVKECNVWTFRNDA